MKNNSLSLGGLLFSVLKLPLLRGKARLSELGVLGVSHPWYLGPVPKVAIVQTGFLKNPHPVLRTTFSQIGRRIRFKTGLLGLQFPSPNLGEGGTTCRMRVILAKRLNNYNFRDRPYKVISIRTRRSVWNIVSQSTTVNKQFWCT